MTQSKLRFFGILLGILMVIGMQGCGGGGGQDSSTSGGGVTSGIAVDPYIVGAIFEEVPAVGGAPLQESSPSDTYGRFAFGKTLTPGSLVRIKAGQQGHHNGIPFAGVLKRVVDSQGELVVSPLTTLLANGLSADDVVALLGEAGLAGITHDDLMADPMAGLDGALPLPGQALRRLQAAMAVNAFFSLADGYEMSAAEIEANRDRLAEMVAMVGTVLGQEQFDQAMTGSQATSTFPAEQRCNLFIQAAVAVTDEMVSALKTDSSLDPVSEAQYLMGAVPELMQFYYAQENRGDQTVEEAIATGTLPDVQVDEAPVILMARWTVHPGQGIGRNKPPVADAGSDQNILVGDSVRLNGSGSYDADGDSLTYRWAFSAKPAGSSAVLVNPTMVNPTFVADAAGTYQVSLVVNDGTLDSGSSVVTIIAANGNVPPVAKAGSNQQVIAGDLVTLNGSASTDADGDVLTYRWAFISRPAGSAAALSNPAAVAPTFATDMAGNYVLSLVVNDGRVDSGISQVTVAAVRGNLQPVANAGTAQSAGVGDQVILDGRGSTDPDGDPLTYKWSFASKPTGSAAALSNTASAQPFFVPDVAGTYVVSLIVRDGQVDSKPANVSILATAPVVVEPTPTPAPTVYEAPVLESVEINGTSWILDWSQPGTEAPSGGYDIIIDGTDTDTVNRTTQLTTVISGLTAGVQHCFQLEGRFLQAEPDQKLLSNNLCTSVTSIPSEPTVPAPSGPLPAFPGAEGFGTETRGGRGGKIIKVTNLNDSGTGSLRAAVDTAEPRIIVFEVSGTIELSSNLNIRSPYCTIAGQTAPSPGITLKNAGISVTTHDVVVQHLRIRVGDSPYGPDPSNRDALQVLGTGAYKVVIDHNSFSWAIDENASTWYSLHDITFSNNIISEGLNRSLHPKGAHSKGLLIGADALNITVKGNLLAHNAERNPLIESNTKSAILNNVFYNCGAYEFMAINGYTESTIKPSYTTAIGNIFKNGINTTATSGIKVGGTVAAGSQIYQVDNIRLPSGQVFGGGHEVSYSPIPLAGYTILPSNQVMTAVTSRSGARPFDRDAVDKRIATEVLNGTGKIIDSQSQVGGWPALAKNTRIFNIPANPNGDDNGNGYSNIEEILIQMDREIGGNL